MVEKSLGRREKRPWRMVRRDSAQAGLLVTLLGEQGVSVRGKPVTGRRIEDLSGDGLLPPEGAPPMHEVAHFRALDALDYGPGKQADETSLRLLSHGFGTERARFVLATGAVDLVQFDGFADDAMPLEIVDTLGSDSGPMAVIAPLLKRVFAALADVPVGGRDTYNGELLKETPAGRKVDLFDDVWRTMSGQSIENPELVYDVAFSADGPFEPDPKHYQRVAAPDEIAIVEEVADQLAGAFEALPEIIANTPITALAQAAVMAQAMFAIVPEDKIPGFDDRRRDVLAAYMAPLLLGMTRANWAPHPTQLSDGNPAT
ncbi:MAG: hypothetical protein ACLPR9_04500 [Acidimicrobiales bacterium]